MERVEALLDRLEHFGVKLGLERMRGVLEVLGSPEAELPVVLVAGTNGKGSTAALLASMLTAAGYRSGLFTSPHLERVEERLRVDGHAIESTELADCLERVISAAETEAAEPVTYFEALAAAALCHFRDQAVDIAVLEVGLGGRLDATNVCDPVLSVITGISYDHQRQLGETLTEIAGEKAGIMRRGRPVVSCQRAAEAASVIARAAANLGCELTEVSDHTRVLDRREIGTAGQQLVFETPFRRYELELGLAGAHQADNAALAIAAAERLSTLGCARLERRAIETGVAACRWPARLEWVQLAERTVLLDAAHNPAGVASLAAYLEDVGRPFTLLFGMLRAKVDPVVTSGLWERADRVVLTAPPSDRALAPAELAQLVGREPDAIIESPALALEECLRGDASTLLVISGSLYLVGEMRTALRSRFGRPPSTDDLFSRAPGSGR